jgi:hypothetical protein
LLCGEPSSHEVLFEFSQLMVGHHFQPDVANWTQCHLSAQARMMHGRQQRVISPMPVAVERPNLHADTPASIASDEICPVRLSSFTPRDVRDDGSPLDSARKSCVQIIACGRPRCSNNDLMGKLLSPLLGLRKLTRSETSGVAQSVVPRFGSAPN